MNNNNNFLYEVTITMRDSNLTETEIKSFINKKLVDVEIVLSNKNVVVLLWPIDETEGFHEIEESLYYVLNEGELGSYTYNCIR